MTKTKLNPETLDRCLERIQSREANLEGCLQEFSEQAELLAPLLRTAALVRQRLALAGPSEAFRAASRTRIQNSMRARLPAAQWGSPTLQRAMWRPARSFASLMIAVGLLAATVGAAYAAGEALPGGPLYGVKRGLEQAALAISPTASGDTKLLLRFAGRRLEEAKRLLLLGRQTGLGLALEGYERTVDQALAAAEEDPDSLAIVEVALDAHEAALLRVLATAPDAAKPAISEALEKSREAKIKVEHSKPERDPSKNPSGHLKKTPGAELEEDNPRRVKDKTPKPPATATPAG